MFIRGRERTALFLCLLWVVVAAASFYLIELTGTFEQDLFRGQGTFWFGILASLLVMIFGLLLFFGQIGFIMPYIFFSEEDISGYNVERISFLLGTLTVVLSYVLAFVTVGGFAIWLGLGAAVAIEVVALYTCAAKGFRADVPGRSS